MSSDCVINDTITRARCCSVSSTKAGSLVGAYYELVSGRVMFSEPVTAQSLPPRDARH